MKNIPSARNAPRWFFPRARQFGSWGFAINRLAALGLTFYLGLHLIILGKLARGQAAYDDFVKLAQTSPMKIGEIILVTAILFHGLNGLRLTALATGIGVRNQKLLLVIVTTLSVFGGFLFTIRLFND